MPTPKVFIRNGQAMIEDGNGGARPLDRAIDVETIENLELKLPKEQMARLRLAMGDQEPSALPNPALLIARVFLKNYASNGKSVQGFLKAIGWETEQVGDDPWNIVASKNGRRYYLDPSVGQIYEQVKDLPSPIRELLGGTEIIADMLDMTVDSMMGTASTAAGVGAGSLTLASGPGALATGAAAAGGTYAGMDSLRQVVGQMMGIPDNVDIPDSLITGLVTSVFSAAVPAGGTALRMMGNKIGGAMSTNAGQRIGPAIKEGLLELQAGLTGTGGAGPRMRPERVFGMRADDRAGILSPVPGVDKKAAAMRRLVRMMSRHDIPERAIAADMEQRATDAGIGVNLQEAIQDVLTPLIREDSIKAAEAKVATSEPIGKHAKDLLVSINNLLEKHGASASNTPISVAVRIKQLVQDRMDERAALLTDITRSGKKAAESVTRWDRELVNFQRGVRVRIATMMDRVGINATDGRPYSKVMSDFAFKSGQLNAWKYNLGVKLSDPEGRKVAASFISNLDDTGMGGFRDLAEQVRQSTGIDVMKHAERAIMSELFGEGGVAKLFPRISAIGEPVGSGVGRKIWNVATGPLAIGVGGGGIVGSLLGGPAGTIAGMGIGGMMSSEAGALAINRFMRDTGGPALTNMAQRGIQTLSSATSALERGVGAKTLTALQSITNAMENRGQNISVDAEAERQKLAAAKKKP